ncbi:MAG: ATP-dependent DNA ligase [Chloroflexi bacterium]|nr:ATP-dependent DNA ligase [Chloroflexota bacterium]
MLLCEIVETSAAVGQTPGRLAKIERVAACLRRLEPDEAAIGVAYLSSQLRQRQIGVGYAALHDLPEPAASSSLTLAAVDAALETIGHLAGRDSQAERRRHLMTLFGRATDSEQEFLSRLIMGELRQGALEGVMLDALARAIGAPLVELRRAVMLRGDLGVVAEAGLRDGPTGLAVFRLQVGQPLQPMLAQSATSVAQALQRSSPAAIEWKLDGARVQIHARGKDVRVFTRTLDDITSRVPELVEMAHSLPVQSIVLDGEALALQADGRPHPFQVSASRFGNRLDVERLRATLPLTPFVFDILHLDGEDLVDRRATERHAILAATVAERWRAPRIVTADVTAAEAFLRDTLAHGHEGVLVKALDSTYEAGRRGAGWIKVKPVHTLDLVILAAEWGHGRRTGWLSNLHLGARDAATGQFIMLGKTFKGLTDAMLTSQTQRLLELETDRDRWTVHVRPELVVEIAFDTVQRSPRYPGGVTLRFARVVRYRPDKRPAEADTLEAVQALGF